MGTLNDQIKQIDRRTLPLIRVGEVVDVDDPKRTGRIKVRLEGIDKDDVTVTSLPYCVPLLPRFLNVMPQIGEIVFVFQYEHKKGLKYTEFSSQRFWIGPAISQINKLENDPKKQARSIMTGGQFKIPEMVVKNTTGAYPNPQDIALQGRDNTDLIFKEGEIWLRAGKFKDTIDKNEFNDRDLGYIQVKYGGENLVRTLKDKTITSYVYDDAKTLIDVKIDSLNSTGEVLQGNMNNSQYSESDKNIVRIKVSKIEDKSILFEQNFLNPGFSTRSEAITTASELIKPFVIDKWKIKSNSKEILKEFGGEEAEKNGVAFFEEMKKEIKKVIKVVKLEPNKDKSGSVINVVANKINLVSHDGPHTFELTNPERLISNEEQSKINNEAHPLVYGDILVEFLKLVKTYVASHIHNYHGMPATELPNKLNVLNFDLDSILNKNINSN